MEIRVNELTTYFTKLNDTFYNYQTKSYKLITNMYIYSDYAQLNNLILYISFIY